MRDDAPPPIYDRRAPWRPHNAGVPDDKEPKSMAQIGAGPSDGGLRKRGDPDTE